MRGNPKECVTAIKLSSYRYVNDLGMIGGGNLLFNLKFFMIYIDFIHEAVAAGATPPPDPVGPGRNGYPVPGGGQVVPHPVGGFPSDQAAGTALRRQPV
ncbi:protein of unknown function [Candidatus Methylocalor cossyra]|uniref:Uncharacterized protein n=1 Tax=Candidatus Methylocalor cossyra TaxID=3108543 RepID=A0ABM9NEU9_9GAMM